MLQPLLVGFPKKSGPMSLGQVLAPETLQPPILRVVKSRRKLKGFAEFWEATHTWTDAQAAAEGWRKHTVPGLDLP